MTHFTYWRLLAILAMTTGICLSEQRLLAEIEFPDQTFSATEIRDENEEQLDLPRGEESLTGPGQDIRFENGSSAVERPEEPKEIIAQGKPSPNLPASFPSSFTVVEQGVFEGRVAFSVEAFGARRIAQLDISTSRVTALVADSGDNTHPSWSPDGQKLAFASNRFGNYDIFVIDWDGANLTRVTNHPADEGDPSWHPNGNSIVFYRDGETKRISNLYSVSLANRAVSQLTNFSEGRNSTPKVSPDGQNIAYSTNRFWPGWDVCLWNLAAEFESCILKGTTSFSRPSWSPKGDKLLFSTGGGSEIDIAVYNLESKNQTFVTALKGREYDATYADEGKVVLFAGEPKGPDQFHLYYMVEEAQPKPFLEGKFGIRYLSWTPKSALQLEVERIKSQSE